MNKCITIYTDASFCPTTKAGGWGCWIKSSPGETSTHSGAFKRKPTNTTQAEMMAIANAIAIVRKLCEPSKKILVVVTDSQGAIDYIDLARKHETVPHRITKKGNKSPCTRCPKLFLLGKTIVGLIPEGCELRVNKVKAHSSKDGARSYVNNLVDKASRSAMRKARTA